MKDDNRPPKESENTYDPDNEEFDITTDEDMRRWRADEVTEKPCHLLRYCPYSDEIICQYPVPKTFDRSLCDQRARDGYKHHCPVFYLAQPGEDMDFAGIGVAENLLESMEHEVERTEQLPPRLKY